MVTSILYKYIDANRGSKMTTDPEAFRLKEQLIEQ